MEPKRQLPVVVIGGTRGTGRLIVQLLRNAGKPVRVLARNPVRARQDLGPAVDVVQGDIRVRATLGPAVDGARHIIFTAGIRSGRPSSEGAIKATEYEGVLNVLREAKGAGFSGRFLYMTAIGVTAPSIAATLLNFYKGNTLEWRRRAEEAIRSSCADYTIIRAGMLCNGEGNQRAIVVSQRPLSLSPRFRIARSDVAASFVAALEHPRASCVTFDIAWAKGRRREPWVVLLDGLHPDRRPESPLGGDGHDLAR
jgi:uncharacterized protein YbjT (DUF2867 family)